MVGILKLINNEWIVEQDNNRYPLHPYDKLFKNETDSTEAEIEFEVRRDCYSGCANTCYQCIHHKDYAILK